MERSARSCWPRIQRALDAAEMLARAASRSPSSRRPRAASSSASAASSQRGAVELRHAPLVQRRQARRLAQGGAPPRQRPVGLGHGPLQVAGVVGRGRGAHRRLHHRRGVRGAHGVPGELGGRVARRPSRDQGGGVAPAPLGPVHRPRRDLAEHPVAEPPAHLRGPGHLLQHPGGGQRVEPRSDAGRRLEGGARQRADGEGSRSSAAQRARSAGQAVERGQRGLGLGAQGGRHRQRGVAARPVAGGVRQGDQPARHAVAERGHRGGRRAGSAGAAARTSASASSAARGGSTSVATSGPISRPVISTRPREPARRRARSAARPGSSPRSPSGSRWAAGGRRGRGRGRARPPRGPPPGPPRPGPGASASTSAVPSIAMPRGRLADEPRPADPGRAGHDHHAGRGWPPRPRGRPAPPRARSTAAGRRGMPAASPWDLDRTAVRRGHEIGRPRLAGSGGVPTRVRGRAHRRRRRDGRGVGGGRRPPAAAAARLPADARACWHLVAPALAERFTVVCADLRGYGDSGKPAGGDDHAGYAKRAMAADMVAAMRALGFERFGAGRPRPRRARGAPAWRSTTPTRWSARRCSTSSRPARCSTPRDQAFATGLLPLVLPDPARRPAGAR